MTQKTVGRAVEVEVTGVADGSIRVEFEVQSPLGGQKRSLGSATGTARGGRVTISGPILGFDEQWNHIYAVIYSSDGKVLGRAGGIVR